MPITFDPTHRTFHLQGPSLSYLFKVHRDRWLVHLHCGGRIRAGELDHLVFDAERAFCVNPDPAERGFALDAAQLELPTFGHVDYRAPALHVEQESGSAITELAYAGHRIVPGKPRLPGLPATYVESPGEADTLEVDLADDAIGLAVTVRYTVFRDRDVLCRSTRVVNRGARPLTLRAAHSLALDLPDMAFELVTLSGAWARERIPVVRPLVPGIQGVGSRRGTTGHGQAPFLALQRPGTTEDAGEVVGLALVYSGSFVAHVEVAEQENPRVLLGIDPFTFSWRLEPGEWFETPEAVLVFSDQGLGGMSRTFHALFRERLVRGPWRDRPRPVVLNSWEAAYFDFDHEKLVRLARTARDVGIDVLVVDDGWFGRRDSDRTSLGDWTVDRRKLPRGLDGLAADVNALGLGLGLWIEPEMVSPDSDLFRAHPDWCLHVPERAPTGTRSQLVLDLGREDVRRAVTDRIAAVLASAPLAYVKWDSNRNLTDVGSPALPPERQREAGHRHVLGVYAMMEELTSRFPEVLFEGCSGGGGRFDPGMLFYMPQIWASDDTDAVERVRIQHGTSYLFPASSVVTHVSAVPNHQIGRVTPLATRGRVALSGSFGYELDLVRLPEAERAELRAQVATYRALRDLVHRGLLFRLQDPQRSERAAWMYVAPDRREAAVFVVQLLTRPNPPPARLRLRGVDPAADYRLEGHERAYGGDELLRVGIPLPPLGDFESVLWRLIRADEVNE
ncbi:MAG TPA: alpha-galactosidase [Anaeromyxobacter sp.]|nr:alpha-galactosidase [Anaeromyxobacter sp.]